MTDTPHDLAAVEQLLAECDALNGWLARLDQASSTVPESVRERVRRDYQGRIEVITNGLREHADTIFTRLRDDRSEHADLVARATASQEALAETELRHMVGEYEPERYTSERTRHTSDIETYQVSISAVAERIAKLEDVHALVSRAPRPVLGEAPELPFEPVPEPSDEGLVPISDLAPEFDSIELLAVFEEAPQEPESSADAALNVVPEFGPLSFRPSGSPASELARPVVPPAWPSRHSEGPVPLGIPEGDAPPRFVRPGERMVPPPKPIPQHATQPVVEARVVDEAFLDQEIVAVGPAPEAVANPVGRTLRCGECGAMNRPLEWYCEKCGAELTAE